jgi:hypothetical protein
MPVTTKTSDSLDKLNELFSILDDFKNKLIKNDYTHKKLKFFKVMDDFQSFLAKYDDKEVIDLFFHSSRYEEYKSFFRLQNNYYMRAIEAAEAFEIMTRQVGHYSGAEDIMNSEYIKRRYIQKSEDVHLLDFGEAENFVMVGCGPLPETILYINDNAAVKNIIGIDNNQEAVYISNELISSLNYDNIQLKYADGADYDYKDADVIYIAGFVTPKHDVLAQIAETGKSDVQILVDSPIGLKRLLFDPIDEGNIHHRLKILDSSICESEYTRANMIKITKFNF